jgi:hypothetical protein
MRPNPVPNPRWLASFRGSLKTHTVRSALLAIASRRIRIEDSEPLQDWAAHGKHMMGYDDAAHASYLGRISESSFVLCPRGLGASSIRLFEVMQAGRVPVIISDAWVAPVGPAWETFSVRVPEREVGRLPHLLAALEPRAQTMGELARAAWQEWFSEEVSFHRAAQWCLDIAAARRASEPLRRWLAYRRLADDDFVSLLRSTGRGYLAGSVRRRLARFGDS